MPLSPEQKERITAEAKRRGIDPDKLIAAAEEHSSGADKDDKTPGKDAKKDEAAVEEKEPAKLFQYHLPFVTVKEVRQVWLGLRDSFPGDNEVAAEWAAKFSGGAGSGTPTPES